jgi:hypothetical protein
MTLSITTREKLDQFLKSFLELIVLFALIISVQRISDLMNLFANSNGDYLGQAHYNLKLKEENIDYNFAILPVFLGIISVIYLLINEKKRYFVISYNILLLIFSTSIFFSGSRRGMIILISIIFILGLIQLASFFKIRPWLKIISTSTRLFIILLVIVQSLSVLIFSATKYEFKNNLLCFFGSKDLATTRGEIAFSIYRYYSALNPSISYNEVYNRLWKPYFDPNEPDSGWGSRVHKTVYPLTGNNVSIVPPDAKGYYIDHVTNGDTLNNQSFSATFISDYSVDESKILKASVFCYVSEDCDVSMAMICSLGSMGNPGAAYNMNNKGSWQKLEYTVNCTKGHISVLLYFSKYGIRDLSSMKGHIIYAYPLIEITDKNQVNSSIFPDSIYFRKVNSITISYSFFIKPTNEASFGTGLQNLIAPRNTEKDFIRKWSQNLIAEDTTYYPYKSDLKEDTLTNNFILGRTLRWHFAIQLFSKEYNWKQKIFGYGFNFLNWYGYYFLNEKQVSDYPHNPFLSILLYSGILGLCFYLFLIYKVILLYFKYMREYLVLFIFFCITFFFSFFSGGSPFDPPVLGFLLILPLFVDSVISKDK